jgi:hypothetical protein
MPRCEEVIAKHPGDRSDAESWLRYEDDPAVHSPVVPFAYRSDEQGGFDNLRQRGRLAWGSVLCRRISAKRCSAVGCCGHHVTAAVVLAFKREAAKPRHRRPHGSALFRRTPARSTQRIRNCLGGQPAGLRKPARSRAPTPSKRGIGSAKKKALSDSAKRLFLLL